MEILQIKYFLDVAETQHMTESAQRLHIAQPALSQAIKRLEESLEVPLFIKKGRGIVLTECGRYLQKHLIPIMEQLDRLPGQLQNMAKLSSETIHINVLAASTLLTETIIEYKNKRKNVNFQILQNSDSDVFDIEITTRMHYQVPPEKENEQFVFSEKIFLAVPNNDKYAHIDSISLIEAVTEKNLGFISLAGSKAFRYICDRFCHNVGVKPRTIFESDNPATVKNMIGANLGVGFWPQYTWGNIDNDRVRLLEIKNPDCHRDILVTLNRNKADNSYVEEFFEFLKESFISRQNQNNIRK